MSLYSVMAFNAATDKLKQNVAESQAIDAKRVETQTAQEELDLNKKLNQAKIKQARNEGMMSDYIGSALEKKLNDQYKAKNDQLTAISGLQDIAQHKAQTQAVQAGKFAEDLHANDPDVQGHVSTMMGIMKQQGPGQPTGPQMSMADGSNLAQATRQEPLPSLPGVTPQAPVSVQQPQQMPEVVVQGQPDAPQKPVNGAVSNKNGGFDLSPIEDTFGVPKGSMWINPATMKAEINPVWKAKAEREQTAQATYDVNQPYREVQRQDRLEKQATDLLTKQLSSRSGGIGLQDNKVNAAIHARQLINQAYDPQTGDFNVTQVPYGELAESVGALLAGNSGSSEGRINSLKQKTAQGDLNATVSYFTGKPSNATSQDALKQLVHIIDRQGEVSEDLRDKYLSDLKKLPVFKQLDDDRAQSLYDSQLGSSYKDYLKEAPDQQQGGSQTATSGKNKDYSSLWQ